MRPETSQRLTKTLLLGLTSCAATFLYLGHITAGPWGATIRLKTGSPHAAFHLFLAHFAFAAFCIFVCSGIGFWLSGRYRVPGAGEIRDIKPLLPYFVLAGFMAFPPGYFLHDRIFILGNREHGWPAMIPNGVGWSLSYIAYGALLKEVVFRFGLITLLSGLFRGRHPSWAVGVVAVFAAGLSMRELAFAGHSPEYDLVTFSVFLWALIFNAALGAAYVKKGLWATIALRVCIDLRFVVYAIIARF